MLSTSIKKRKSAQTVGVKKIEKMANEDVYNMEVLGTHCFSVDGGIIVHNCMDAIRYLVRTKRLVRRVDEYHSIFGG